VRAIGSRYVLLTPERHDAAVAAISHLPYLLSVGLVGTVEQMAKQDPAPWKLASSGFRDTSRLAGSDLTMMGDILMTNREAVLDALKIFEIQMQSLESAVRTSDEATLRGILGDARTARLHWANRSPE
jgi:prephenate dehydrogenase